MVPLKMKIIMLVIWAMSIQQLYLLGSPSSLKSRCHYPVPLPGYPSCGCCPTLLLLPAAAMKFPRAIKSMLLLACVRSSYGKLEHPLLL
ncbi:hypothetical protein CDL15_Pgr016750 [Punica granatum]|uniref:Secreted protein n=1 Tax=Punica granatum TaxID=22663 RepID=A0A218WXH2_PUNGR|nr:hypothetical protein CDL15_Pgr016750 [Punica granatum]